MILKREQHQFSGCPNLTDEGYSASFCSSTLARIQQLVVVAHLVQQVVDFGKVYFFENFGSGNYYYMGVVMKVNVGKIIIITNTTTTTIIVTMPVGNTGSSSGKMRWEKSF